MSLTDDEQRKSIAEMIANYKRAQGDTSEVDAAIAANDQADTRAGVGQGLATMLTAASVARGGPGPDSSFYDSIRSQARNRIKDAQEARTGKLSGIKDEIGMGRDSLKDSADAERLGMDKSRLNLDQSRLDADLATNKEKNARNILESDRDYGLKQDKLALDQAEFDAKSREQAEPKPLTEGQAKAAGYLTRMQDANKALVEAGDISQESLAKLASQDARNTLLDTKIMGVPVGAAVEASGLARRPRLGDALTDQEQIAYQAQQQWIDATLRDDSGASLPPDEIEKKQNELFPQVGDSPAAIERKRQARDAYAKAMSQKLQDPNGFTPVNSTPKNVPPPPKPPIDQKAIIDLPDKFKSVFAKEMMSKGQRGLDVAHRMLMSQDAEYRELMNKKAANEHFIKEN